MTGLHFSSEHRICLADRPEFPPEEELLPEAVEGPVMLQELGRYYLKCYAEVPDAVREAPYVVQPFPNGLFEISFRNCVGLTRIGPLPVVILNRKMTEEQYWSMLESITTKAANLVFAFSPPSGQNVERTQPGRDVAYLEMLFLRKYLLQDRPDIEALASIILSQTHRRFIRLKTRKKIQDVAEIDPNAWLEMTSNPQYLSRLPVGHPLETRSLARVLKKASGKSLYPSELIIEETTQTVDTPENRFVKHLLDRLLGKFNLFQEVTDSIPGVAPNQDLAEDMDRLEKQLRRFRQAGLWREVSEMRVFPASSQILQRREGYRSLFRLNALLSLATQCQFTLPDFATIIETKDAPTLYEYWCFFVIKDLLETMVKSLSARMLTHRLPKEETLQQGLILDYEGGVRLSFNRTFQAPKQSYSHNLRPDIILEIGDRRLIFDAKYKGQSSGFYGEQTENGMIHRWREEDIDKMHAYRDAISGVHGAFILYPGEAAAIFNPPTGQGLWHGVGALPLQPDDMAGADPEQVERVKSIIQAFVEGE